MELHEEEIEKKTDKLRLLKKYKFIWVLLGLLLLAIIFFFINRFLRDRWSDQEYADGQVVSVEEWNEIKSNILVSYPFQYLNQSFQAGFGISTSSDSSTPSIFKTAYNLVNLPLNNSENVLGETVEAGSPTEKLNTSQLKFRLNGGIENPETGEIENYELFISNIAAQDSEAQRGVSDLLINGEVNNLKLGDPDFDALHISLIEPDQETAYVKVSISDVFVILLDRILYGPDPEAAESGIISVEYDEIYPYFDQYVEINKDLEIQESKELPQELRIYLRDYQQISREAFRSTIGNIDNYLSQKGMESDTIAGESIYRVKTKVDASSLLKEISNYLDQTAEFANSKKSVYEPYCQENQPNNKQDCLARFGFVPEENLNNNYLKALAAFIKFDKFDLILNAPDKEFTGIDLEVSLNEGVFKSFSGILPEDLSGIKNINNLNLQFTFSNLSRREVSKISKPLSYIHFPQGDSQTPQIIEAETLNETEVFAESLYSINRQYVSSVRQEDLDKLSGDKRIICPEETEFDFCLEVGGDWTSDEYSGEESESFKLTYPSEYRSAGDKHISIDFRNVETKFQGATCREERYQDFSETKTEEGFVFRIYKMPDNEGEFVENKEFSADICYKNPNGEFTYAGPVADRIRLYSREVTFEEVSKRVVPILNTIELKEREKVDLEKDYSKKEDEYETFYLDNAKNDVNSCKVSFHRDENGYSEDYENIKKDYSIDRDFRDIVIEEGIVFCRGENCLKCVKGDLEWQELSVCKGMTCNP